jgi:hypothetical protein
MNMAFFRINHDESGDAHLENLDVPENIRLSEAEIADQLLREKDKSRNPQFQALIPTPEQLEHSPNMGKRKES